MDIFSQSYGHLKFKGFSCVRIPPYEKKIKRAAELRTMLSQWRWGPVKRGHWSDLSGGQSSTRAGKF